MEDQHCHQIALLTLLPGGPHFQRTVDVGRLDGDARQEAMSLPQPYHRQFPDFPEDERDLSALTEAC